MRFITLTLRSSASPLKEQLERLYKAWETLRQKSSLSKSFKGGVGALEVKWNPFVRPDADGRLGHWHPHLHVVCEGSFIAQKELSKVWLRITGDSHIVDIRQVRSPEQVAGYICKYVTKLPKIDTLHSIELIREYADALVSVRCINAWGTWRKLGLLAEPDNDLWDYLGSLTHIMKLAMEGQIESIGIINALCNDVDLHWSELPSPRASPPPT